MADRITSNYADHSKAELLAEVALRKETGSQSFAGINSADSKGDIVAALEVDDGGGSPAPEPPKPPNAESQKPAKSRQMRYLADVGDHNPELFTVYEVAGDDKPWKAKSETRFWEGTRAELLSQFEEP